MRNEVTLSKVAVKPALYSLFKEHPTLGWMRFASAAMPEGDWAQYYPGGFPEGYVLRPIQSH